MPWRCPACSIPIRHSEPDDRPRAGQRYRCHVCRLELVFDLRTNKLKVAPLHDEEDEKQR